MDFDLVPILVPAIVFTAIVLVFWAPFFFMVKSREAFHATIRTALDKGVELSPETIKVLGAPKRSRLSDVRSGLIWIAVAAGCVAFGWALRDQDEEVLSAFLGIAAFPGFIGLALLGFGIVTALMDERE